MNFNAQTHNQNQELDRHLAAQELNETCENCRLYHSPKCYERKDYKRDANPADWCWGHRKVRKP